MVVCQYLKIISMKKNLLNKCFAFEIANENWRKQKCNKNKNVTEQIKLRWTRPVYFTNSHIFITSILWVASSHIPSVNNRKVVQSQWEKIDVLPVNSENSNLVIFC